MEPKIEIELGDFMTSSVKINGVVIPVSYLKIELGSGIMTPEVTFKTFLGKGCMVVMPPKEESGDG